MAQEKRPAHASLPSSSHSYARFSHSCARSPPHTHTPPAQVPTSRRASLTVDDEAVALAAAMPDEAGAIKRRRRRRRKPRAARALSGGLGEEGMGGCG